MSYICDICGLPSDNSERQHSELVRKRKQTYETLVLYRIVKRKKRWQPPKVFYKFFHNKENFPTAEELEALKELGWQVQGEKISYGWEIVKENKVCTNCQSIVNNKDNNAR